MARHDLHTILRDPPPRIRRPLLAQLPAHARLLLVPALAVDVRGRRLGRGGGYYDRFLAGPAGMVSGRIAAWAIVYDNEILAEVPSEAHDVPVTAALTPGRYADFPGR